MSRWRSNKHNIFLACLLPRPSLARGPTSVRLPAPVVLGPPLSPRGRYLLTCFCSA